MKWLITGSSGLLGHSLCEYLASQNREVTGLHHSHPIEIANIKPHKINLINFDALTELVHLESPDVLVHAAGLTDVDACEANEELANALHTKIPQLLARAAKNCNAQFVSISTDHLWDGRDLLTNENKPPQPLNAYARTKYLGEVKALGANSNSLIIRTNFFGPGRPWRSSFSDWIINSLQSKQSITTFTDSHFTPIGLSHLCPLLHQLVERSASGIFNLAGRERISKFDFSIRLAVFLGLDRNLIQPGTVEDANLVAQRPKDMSLSVDKIEKFLNLKMPNLDESFASLLQKPHGRNNL